MNSLSTDANLSPESIQIEKKPRLLWWGLGTLVVAATVVGLVAFNGRLLTSKSSPDHSDQSQNKPVVPIVVEAVHPQAGGIDRLCIQPGSVEPFESADLYAKVSGFLLSTVDIGTRVKQGELLAQLWVPEYEKQVKKDEATVERQKASVKQMEAHLTAAEAEAKAAKQLIVQAQIEAKSKAAYRSYRTKSLDRIKLLFEDKSIDAVILDQETDRHEAAVEAENAAKEAVETARLKWEAAKAREVQANADIDDAKAQLDVAKAELEKAKVLLEYTFIRSPYDGVVTKRNFNRGDFIRSADVGRDRIPIVAVDRTDLMRIVVQVPDHDVPYVDKGDPATVEIDALPGKPYKGVVARAADAEDVATRTMRTEIDVPNTDGKLRRNMYGRVKMILQPGAPTALRVPSGAVVAKGTGGRTYVRVIRDHRAQFVPVELGQDTGVEVEILRGLQLTDDVIVRANGPLEDGTEVTTEVKTEADFDTESDG